MHRVCTDGERKVKTLQSYNGMLEPYRWASSWYSIWQLVSTFAAFVAVVVAMYFCLSVSYWLTFALAPVGALLRVRLFILQHDCGHRSYFRSQRANDLIGSLLGILSYTPYHCWRREHAVHHATSGDLDRRGRFGEIRTMTLSEYRQSDWKTRLAYRVYRFPLFLFLVAPALHFVIRQRLTLGTPKAWRRERRSIWWTNLGLVTVLGSLCWLVGWRAVLIMELPMIVIAGQIGVWLFYIQHQYEDAFWEPRETWNYVDAAIAGSSYYRLPRVLQWFTGNIGFHHIHHLDSRIPNYRLQACHENNPELQRVHEMTLRDSLSCASVKLWDEESGKMVPFPRRAWQR